MARDGSGNYTLPANTLAVSGDAISSTKFNSLVQDLESDANVDRPVAAGGTGASTAAGARTNLGLVIGTDVQAFDQQLLDIAASTRSRNAASGSPSVRISRNPLFGPAMMVAQTGPGSSAPSFALGKPVLTITARQGSLIPMRASRCLSRRSSPFMAGAPLPP